ncbi:MAG: ferritin family protein [Calditrichaeota bacterium]|nr:ferritin family protein [Calditrichota bacterium]
MKEEVYALLKNAIQLEKNGLETYLRYARQTQDLAGKNMFIVLANDEFDHMNLLEGILQKIEKDESLQDVKVDHSVIETVIPKLRDKDVQTKGTEGQDQLSALRVAVDLERDSIKLYEAIRDKTDDPEVKRIAQRLVEMEDSHYQLIQAEIDSIMGMGMWFGFKEFDLNAG